MRGFRVWCKNKNEWEQDVISLLPNGKLFDIFHNIHLNMESYIVEFDTGLTDKNGVKIFEHDLVQIEHPCWHAKCEVKFIDGAFFFCELDNPVQNAWIRQDKFQKEEWKIKVIGNIYEVENER